MLAPWIIDHLPPHRVYVEPFGGAGSVLLRKPRSYGEVYNDLDGEVVSFFRVLRDPEQADRLRLLLELTPFARDEFEGAYEETGDTVEAARRLIIRSFMGFGTDGANGRNRTGFRANANRSGTTPAHDWANYPDHVGAFSERLRGVVIENRHGAECMKQHDGPDTLHYVDPPYLHETRRLGTRKACYRHEMTDEQHKGLLATLLALDGMVVVSGYPSPLYDAALAGWRRETYAALADGASPRLEVLWINPAADACLAQRMLFA